MTLRFTSTSNIKFWCISNVPRSVFVNEANCNFMTFVMWRPWHLALGDFPLFLYTKVCLKKHSCNLHAPLCGIFRPNSVAVARYGALIRAKSLTNCDAHLAESLFQTRSRVEILHKYNMDIPWNWYSKFIILNVMGCQSQKVWQTKGFIYEKTTEKKQRNYSTYIYDEQRTVLAEV